MNDRTAVAGKGREAMGAMVSEVRYPSAGATRGVGEMAVDLTQYAAGVHLWMNMTIFVDILKAVEEEAAKHGLQFVRGASTKGLSEEIKVCLGEAAMRAQLRHVSPFMSPDDVEVSMTRWLADGDCGAWAAGILGALDAQGVGIIGATNVLNG
jgi:hypothetical protein